MIYLSSVIALGYRYCSWVPQIRRCFCNLQTNKRCFIACLCHGSCYGLWVFFVIPGPCPSIFIPSLPAINNWARFRAYSCHNQTSCHAQWCFADRSPSFLIGRKGKTIGISACIWSGGGWIARLSGEHTKWAAYRRHSTYECLIVTESTHAHPWLENKGDIW